MRVKRIDCLRLVAALAAFSGLASGVTWNEIDAGIPRTPVGVRTVVADPSSPSTVYALSLATSASAAALFKSTDGGASWKSMPGISSVTALVIDPSSTSTLYALHGTVAKSVDGGQTWTDTPLGQTASALAIDPQNPATLYAMSGTGIYKTTNAGSSWVLKTSGLPTQFSDGHFAIDPQHSSNIFAATGWGLYKSADAGETWTGPLGAGSAYCNCPVAIDPANPSIVYAVLANGSGGDPTYLNKSGDGGATWGVILRSILTDLAVDPSSAVYASFISFDSGGNDVYGMVKSTDFGNTWGVLNTGLPSNVKTYGIAPSRANPGTLFAGYYGSQTGGGGVISTLNGGGAWNDSSKGLALTTVHALAVDPVNSATVYVAAGDGVSKSTDRGGNWTTVHFPSNVPLPWLGQAFVPSLLVDPSNPNVVYASVLGTGGCEAGDTFLKKSTDGGATWTDLPVTYCAIGPAISLAMTRSDPDELYAAPQDAIDCEAYVFSSSDGGTSWNQSGMGGVLIASLAIGPGTPGALYAGLVGLARAGGGVARSTDNGQDWTTLGLTNVNVNVLLFDPREPSVLYAGTSMGLYKSTDGGGTWSTVGTGIADANVTALVIDPKLSIFYLGTSTGVFRSSDEGRTWSSLNDGLPDLDVRALAVSSDGSGVVYLGVSSGVFSTVDKLTVQGFPRRD